MKNGCDMICEHFYTQVSLFGRLSICQATYGNDYEVNTLTSLQDQIIYMGFVAFDMCGSLLRQNADSCIWYQCFEVASVSILHD